MGERLLSILSQAMRGLLGYRVSACTKPQVLPVRYALYMRQAAHISLGVTCVTILLNVAVFAHSVSEQIPKLHARVETLRIAHNAERTIAFHAQFFQGVNFASAL